MVSRIFASLAISLLLSGCSDEEDGEDEEKRGSISYSDAKNCVTECIGKSKSEIISILGHHRFDDSHDVWSYEYQIDGIANGYTLYFKEGKCWAADL